MFKPITSGLMTGLFLISAPAFAHQAPPAENVKVYYESHDLGAGIYMLRAHHTQKGIKTSTGSNVAISTGADGTLVIDSQFSRNAAGLLGAIQAVSDGKITYLVNTHFHGDHSGGNDRFRDKGVMIIAHDNARQRMEDASLKRKRFPVTEKGLPILTFSDELSFHRNGHNIRAIYLKPGHTDGDIAIHIKSQNVIHTGDAFFSKRYPYIDIASGGSFAGYFDNLKTMHDLCDADTKIIPGHGPLMSCDSLLEVRETLQGAHSRIVEKLKTSESLDALIAEKPLADISADYGQWGITEEKFIRMIYNEEASKTSP